MPPTRGTPRRPAARSAAILVIAALAGVLGLLLLAGLIALMGNVAGGGASCQADQATTIALGPPGSGRVVGATEYGGPGDPSSGTVGASGLSLLAHPDSYAELGGETFQTATAMGRLAYMTPLRITWRHHSAVAYKRDFGLGGGPIDGLPRVIDLWWQLAARLGIPYDGGLWSGPVRVERPPPSGAASLLGDAVAPSPSGQDPSTCSPGALSGVSITAGDRAQLLPGGTAGAPAAAPLAVKEIIAAGNQIVGKPYLYGGGHGLALSMIGPAYDCSSSVEHLLYGARLLPVTYSAPSGDLESFGEAGIGRWVTVYASAGHVFMYVAGLRWDTHNAAGPGDGSAGIGWHPLVRSAAGFIARHPVGL